MPPAGRTAAPRLPRSASCHASSIQLDVTGACFIHTLSEPRSLRSAIHAARASAAIALCFFALHAPEATRAAYSSEYRIHMGPVVLRSRVRVWGPAPVLGKSQSFSRSHQFFANDVLNATHHLY